MSAEKDILHEVGAYFAIRCGKTVEVRHFLPVGALVDSTFPFDKDGISLAVARVDYLAGTPRVQAPRRDPHAAPMKDEECERIAQAAARVLKADGKPTASQYIYGALEGNGAEYSRLKSSIKQWEIQALADRALWLFEHP
jgi:hypothetical protein